MQSSKLPIISAKEFKMTAHALLKSIIPDLDNAVNRAKTAYDSKDKIERDFYIKTCLSLLRQSSMKLEEVLDAKDEEG
jgi:hypothetical protein